MTPLEQQTILITGATDGLGRALAAELAPSGAHLLLHGRSAERGTATLDELREHSPDARLTFLRADLADLREVAGLADAVRRETDRLDVLVSNAGIGMGMGEGESADRETSAQGHELRLAVNYLAGYALIRELLPVLRSSTPARIVQVSSAGQAPIDFDDPMLERGYDGVRAYCRSKLAQILLTMDLAEELEGTGVSATTLHPATYMPTKMVPSPTSTLEEGVRATYRLVADPALDGVTGRYFDGEREAEPHAQASDPDARRRLRELSEDLVAAAAP